MGHQRSPSTGLSRAASLRSNGASGSSSRSSSPSKPTPSIPSASASTSIASPRTSRLAPPSSPVKRPNLALQPRKSFARQSPGEPTAPMSPVLQNSRIGTSPSQETTNQVQRTSSPLSLPPQNAIVEPPLPPTPVVQALRQPPTPIESTPSLTNGTTLAPPTSISRVPSHDPSSPITVGTYVYFIFTNSSPKIPAHRRFCHARENPCS